MQSKSAHFTQPDKAFTAPVPTVPVPARRGVATHPPSHRVAHKFTSGGVCSDCGQSHFGTDAVTNYHITDDRRVVGRTAVGQKPETTVRLGQLTNKAHSTPAGAVLDKCDRSPNWHTSLMYSVKQRKGPLRCIPRRCGVVPGSYCASLG